MNLSKKFLEAELFFLLCPSIQFLCLKLIVFIFHNFSTLAAPLTALYMCSYIFPFTNWKGAASGLLTGIGTATLLFYVYFRITPSRLQSFPKPCLNATDLPYTSLPWPQFKFAAHSDLDFAQPILHSVVNETQKWLPILGELPIAWYPMASFLVCIIHSFCGFFSS